MEKTADVSRVVVVEKLPAFRTFQRLNSHQLLKDVTFKDKPIDFNLLFRISGKMMHSTTLKRVREPDGLHLKSRFSIGSKYRGLNYALTIMPSENNMKLSLTTDSLKNWIIYSSIIPKVFERDQFSVRLGAKYDTERSLIETRFKIAETIQVSPKLVLTPFKNVYAGSYLSNLILGCFMDIDLLRRKVYIYRGFCGYQSNNLELLIHSSKSTPDSMIYHQEDKVSVYCWKSIGENYSIAGALEYNEKNGGEGNFQGAVAVRGNIGSNGSFLVKAKSKIALYSQFGYALNKNCKFIMGYLFSAKAKNPDRFNFSLTLDV